jgi:DNA-binding CsgD family transcriptional regulator
MGHRRPEMSKSRRLRLQDVRRAFRLVGDCRDLGDDSSAWRLRSFEGLMGLIGARVAIGGEFGWQHDPRRPIGVVQSLDAGFEPHEHAHFAGVMREGDASSHPVTAPLHRLSGRVITRTRRQLVDDATWYRSAFFNEHVKPIRIDHCVNSLCELPAAGTFNLIGLHRAPGERDFSGRERRLLHLFHGELGLLVGTPLVAAGAGDLAGLSPRLRQTLDCLLDGDAEKRVAARLGLSLPTVHQYVTMLYRRFGVASRAELMARFIRRP